MQELSSTPVTRLQVIAAVACAFALAIDMIEIAIGNVLSTVFSAPAGAVRSAELSVLLSSVFLGAVLGAPLLGWIADRRGIRSCLVAALAWLALMSCLAGASATLWHLSVLRFLSGLSLGAIPPLLIAYLTRIAPARYRGAFIFWVCGSAALVPPLALLLIRPVIRHQPFGVEGWRWPLYAAGVLSLIAGCFFYYLPQSLAGSETRSAAVTVHGVGAKTEHRSSGRFVFVACIYFLLPWASVGFPLLTGPLLLRQGYDLSQALLYVALATLGPSIGSFVTTSFVDQFDRRVILAACAVVMIGSVLLFARARTPTGLATALIVFGIAAAIYVTALTIYAAEIFPADVRTFATSSAWAINRAAAALVPVILIPLVGAQGAFISMLPICLALAVSVLLIVVRGPDGTARRAVA